MSRPQLWGRVKPWFGAPGTWHVITGPRRTYVAGTLCGYRHNPRVWQRQQFVSVVRPVGDVCETCAERAAARP